MLSVRFWRYRSRGRIRGARRSKRTSAGGSSTSIRCAAQDLRRGRSAHGLRWLRDVGMSCDGSFVTRFALWRLAHCASCTVRIRARGRSCKTACLNAIDRSSFSWRRWTILGSGATRPSTVGFRHDGKEEERARSRCPLFQLSVQQRSLQHGEAMPNETPSTRTLLGSGDGSACARMPPGSPALPVA